MPPRRDPRRRCQRQRGGFTLIEFLAVIALMAVISGIAAVSLVSFAHGHALDDAIGRVRFADSVARDRAAVAGRAMVLRIHLDDGRFDLIDGGATTALATLPGSVRVVEAAGPGDRTGYGYLDVPFAATGFTPTYAIHLEGDRDVWLVAAGLTGQMEEVSVEQVDTLLALGRTDAD